MQQAIIDEPLLTFNEAKDYLRISRSTLLRWMEEGLVPAYKVGSGWRFYRSELKQAIKPVVVVRVAEQGVVS